MFKESRMPWEWFQLTFEAKKSFKEKIDFQELNWIILEHDPSIQRNLVQVAFILTVSTEIAT